MKYSAQLKSPRWQRRRLEIMTRDEWACQSCGATETQLHVHHLEYRPGPPWAAQDADLVTVCTACHGKAHTLEPIEWSEGVWGRWLDRFRAMGANTQEGA